MKKHIPTMFRAKYALLVLALFFIHVKGYSTHAMGGDIWYECNGGSNYTLYFAFYRDCDGVNAPNTITIDYSSSCTGT
ncbi:MAG: hypothetical protein JKY54_19140, partial [Flavobacteriales bacterium]|nr:hypothetical protein [Flavobacteriales bacterium]